jgi:ATP-dependent Clp protease ATP-binding subunit ClpC
VEQREGLRRRGVRLRFTPELVDFIVATGFSPKYGARPLQRAVEQHVVATVARALFGSVAEGAWLEVGIEAGAVRVVPAAPGAVGQP